MAPRSSSVVLGLYALLVGGCGSSESDEASSGGPGDCAPGEWLRDDGVCVPAGLPPDMPCPPGEWQREEDGACIPAGIPPDGCGVGFVHDGDRGCEPILPEGPCPEGLMAVPGERSCREVAPCAPGSWGDVPIEPDTEYVDASYTGGASDGSASAPWTSIQAGVDAALAGAIVAVAGGSYVEDVRIEDKSVRLWGRCPALVELAGTGAELAALFIRAGASGSEVRRLAITGQAMGVLLSGSEDVLVEEAWIHDNALRGLNAQADFGPTSVVVRGSLLEQNHELGVFVSGSDATLEATVVRDTLHDEQGMRGTGTSVQADPETGARASVTVARSLFEQNHEFGVFVGGSDATLEATVVRATLPDAQGFGRGMNVQADPATGARARVIVARSLFEQNHDLGVHVSGSDATLETTMVRDTLPDAQGLVGRGMNVQADPETGARASVTIARSLLEQNHTAGVFVSGSDATVEATVVRDTLLDAPGLLGRGMSVQDDPAKGARASVTVARSLLEQNHTTGVFVSGSDATLEAIVMRDTLPDAQGPRGRAVQVQSNPKTGNAASVTLRASLFERSVEAAIFVIGAATAELEACILRDTVSSQHGILGDGLVVWSKEGPASAVVTATRIEQSERAAVTSFGAAVALESSLLVCQSFDIGAESWQGENSIFDNRGGVLCGCPKATEPCKAQSYALEPPPPPGE